MAILTKNHTQLTAEVNRHIEADSVEQRSYRTGGLIGCLAHHQDDPKYIEDKYGIPIVLSRIIDRIFENLPAQDAVDLFAAFPVAIAKDGKDLTKVPWKFLVGVLKKLPEQPDEAQKVIDPVIAGLTLIVEGKEWNKDDAHGVVLAARKVALNALQDAAAWAATWSAEAYVDSYALVSWAAMVVGAATRAGVPIEWQRDLILRLIEEA
jgi:hypothetical protein